jgi:hypothetical protein
LSDVKVRFFFPTLASFAPRFFPPVVIGGFKRRPSFSGISREPHTWLCRGRLRHDDRSRDIRSAPALSAAITCDAEAIGELVEKQCETDFQLQLICF